MDEQEWLTSDDPARMLRFLEGFHEPQSQTYTGRKKCATDRKLRLFACACCRQVWDRLTDDAPCGRCGGSGHLGAQKLYLWLPNLSCDHCHGTGRINRSRRAVEVAELYADGLATSEERGRAFNAADNLHGPQRTWSYGCLRADPVQGVREILEMPCDHEGQIPATQAALLRCIVGNPWKPVRCSVTGNPLGTDTVKVQGLTTYGCDCRWLTHNDGAVAKLARAIYGSRRWDELPILADALREAGCPEEMECPHCHGKGVFEVRIKGEPDIGLEKKYIMKPSDSYPCLWCGGYKKVPHPLIAHLLDPGAHARGCHAIDCLLGLE